MLCLANPISQPSLDISPICIPLISCEITNWGRSLWKIRLPIGFVGLCLADSVFHSSDGASRWVDVTLRLTVGQSVSMSWYRAPLWDLRPNITSCRNVAVWNLRYCFCGAPSLTRERVCNLQCRAEPVTILYCLIWDSPNLEGQLPVFKSPRNRVAQLYPRALGSLYVASYDSPLTFRNRMVQSKVKSRYDRWSVNQYCS
jgi:hypothetical protein